MTFTFEVTEMESLTILEALINYSNDIYKNDKDRDLANRTWSKLMEQVKQQYDKKVVTEWNYNLNEAPLNTPIKLLSADDLVLPQREYIGTIIDNEKGLIRGECIEGDSDFFYRSAIVAWKELE